MALDKQTVGVTLHDGLDTHEDPRTLIPGKLTAVSNLCLSENGTLARVDPRIQLTNAQSIDSLSLRGTELLGLASRKLYALNMNNKSLVDHGYMSGCVVRTEPIFTQGASQSAQRQNYLDCEGCDVAYSISASTLPLVCYVWTEDTNTGGSATSNIYLRIADGTTGTTILGPTQLSANTSGIYGTRVVATSDAFIAFWTEGDSTLHARVVQFSAPSTLGADTTLRTDVTAGAAACIDACAVPQNGTAFAYVVYTTNDGTTSVRAIRVTQSAGTPSVATGPTNIEAVANVTAAQVSSLAIASNPSGSTFPVGILAASTAARPGLITAILDSSVSVLAAAAQKDATAAPVIARGPYATVTIAAGVSTFQVLSDRREQCGNTAAALGIRSTTVNSSNTITAGPTTIFFSSSRPDGRNGPFLGGKAYLQNSRSYVPLVVTGARLTAASTTSQLQNCWMLADVTARSYVARCLYGNGGTDSFGLAMTHPAQLPSCAPIHDGGGNVSDHITVARQQVPATSLGLGTQTVNICGMTKVLIRPHNASLAPETRPQWAECAGTTFYADAIGSAYAGSLPAPTSPAGTSNTDAAEASFLLFPETISAADTGSGSNPLAAGTYQFVALYEWFDGAGQRHQSAPSPSVSLVCAGANQAVITIPTLQATLMRQVCSLVVYRTEPSPATRFYRVNNPTVALSVGLNDITAASVNVSISSVATMPLGEPLYTDSGILDNDGPAPMSCTTVHQGRILADVTDDAFAFQYSQAPVDGFGLQWSSDLRGTVDPTKGKITAVASLDDRGVLFRERGITILNGQPPGPDGLGGSYLPTDLPTDVGCMWPHSVCAFDGGILFKSNKGWHVLDRSLQVRYVGEGAAAWDATVGSTTVQDAASNAVYSATLSDARKEIRIESMGASSTRLTLLYNYELNQWTTMGNAVSMTSPRSSVWWPASFIWRASSGNSPGLVTGLMASANFDVAADVPVRYANGSIAPGGADANYIPLTASFTTGWLKPSEAIQGFQRVWWVLLAGSVADQSTTPGSTLTVTLETVMDGTTSSNSCVFTANSLLTSGSTWECRIKPNVQKCELMRISASDVAASAGAGLNFSGITLVVGVKKGAAKLAAGKTL